MVNLRYCWEVQLFLFWWQQNEFSMTSRNQVYQILQRQGIFQQGVKHFYLSSANKGMLKRKRKKNLIDSFSFGPDLALPWRHDQNETKTIVSSNKNCFFLGPNHLNRILKWLSSKLSCSRFLFSLNWSSSRDRQNISFPF